MAATKSFTAEMYALYLLTCAVMDTADDERIPDAFAEGVRKSEGIDAHCSFLDSSLPCYVIGRGKLYALAKEACCKLQETCLVSAFPFSAADFMHGPFALVEKGSRVIVLHSRHACADSTLGMITSLLEQKADVLVITDDPSVKDICGNVITVDTENENESVFAITAVIQLLAATLSEIRGTDPDTSRNLSKYTETI